MLSRSEGFRHVRKVLCLQSARLEEKAGLRLEGGYVGGKEVDSGGFRCLEVGLTWLGTGLHGGQEELSFLCRAAGDEALL